MGHQVAVLPLEGQLDWVVGVIYVEQRQYLLVHTHTHLRAGRLKD